MGTLLLRLSGPLQSWGTSSRFTRRMTGQEPSKSGVLGMIAAALGRNRDHFLEDLRALRFGVRIDQPGSLLRDFHTAHTASSSQAFVSNRYYLADAVFLVGLEGEENYLQSIKQALATPYFPLSLGRRSCPPTGKLVIGLYDHLALREALDFANTPWMPCNWYRRKVQRQAQLRPNMTSIEIICDADAGILDGYSCQDVPESFDQTYRRYSARNIHREWMSLPDYELLGDLNKELPTKHNVMEALEVN